MATSFGRPEALAPSCDALHPEGCCDLWSGSNPSARAHTLSPLSLSQTCTWLPVINSAVVQLGGFSRPPIEVPPPLRASGVSSELWAQWRGHMEAEQRAHLCHDNPACGIACYCCPLGPVQCLLCTLTNPATCWDAFRVKAARKEATRQINDDLAPLGAHFQYTDNDQAIFRRGMPKLRKKPKTVWVR